MEPVALIVRLAMFQHCQSILGDLQMSETDTMNSSEINRAIEIAEVAKTQTIQIEDVSGLKVARRVPLQSCPTNIDTSTYRGKVLLLAAKNPADVVIDPNSKDEEGRAYIIITAHYYLVYPDEILDDASGEVKQFQRTVFISEVGKTFKTSSPFAVQRIKDVTDLFGPDVWNSGVRLRITERKSRNPKRQSPYHDIRLD